MCGLTAFLALRGLSAPGHNGKFPADQAEDALKASMKIVKHRGPDAEGHWISSDSEVALGHVRLSIIDLSPSGNQPFHDSQDDIHAVVNGELYDYEHYRTQFEKEYNFKGNSDCEIVIALYRHYGIDFLSHLRGEFALVLWDAKRKLFFAARDRFGIKSLYYTVVDGRLLVATEMKSFLPYGWKPEWSIQNLRDKSYEYGSDTLFKNVYSYLISQDFQPPTKKLYWETRSEEEIIKGIRERLLEAVRLRLRADVPVGIYLSGGLDSSSIAGMVTHLVKQEHTSLGSDASGAPSRIRCFTVQFDKDSGVDESDIAQRTAEWLGVGYEPVYMDEQAMATRLEDTIWHTESPTADVNGMARLAMSEIAHARGIKVVLTGEGADEHFSGYADFWADRFREPDQAWPPSLSEGENLFDSYKAFTKKPNIMATLGPSNAKPVSEEDKKMLNNSVTGCQIDKFTQIPFASWTNKFANKSPQAILAEKLGDRVLDKIANKWHPLHTSEYIWTKSILCNHILRYIGDNIDMVHHVETRPPFLDHNVTEYANNIPPSLKMKYDPESDAEQGPFLEKHVLRQAMKPFITEEIYNRRKHPFLGPAKYTENGPMHTICKKLLTKENVEQVGFLDWDAVEDSLNKAYIHKDPFAMRRTLVSAQLVVLSQRFKVKRSEPPLDN
ncbi:hypothetical protein OIDMADRAFT_108177 [Oidiodendron maius Zn]|uniref:asparagine synthase (glutamine-hydrolyzing) n=1 Tax=Oidiodendron maius (strain Zn) TaxID=913774 RepID=A0A0C3DBS1_OIDMZ|nr:hypothetical protein OIDMADRAFT_108177 [Oidiodendron maius Zn]